MSHSSTSAMRKPSNILLENRNRFYPSNELPRTPYPTMETVLFGPHENVIRRTESENEPSEAINIAPSLGSRTDPGNSEEDLRKAFSSATLTKALTSVMEQVDWGKVVADVGEEGTVMTLRTAFEDIVRTKLRRLRWQGEMYHSRSRRDSMSELSSFSSFIETDTDDFMSKEYQDGGADESEETDEENAEQHGFYGDEADEDEDDGTDDSLGETVEDL